MLVAMLRDVSSHVQELKQRHRQVMQNMLMDMLRALATPNMDIRKKTLDIALDLINQHNIDEVLPAAWQPCVSALLALLACFTRALTARVHVARDACCWQALTSAVRASAHGAADIVSCRKQISPATEFPSCSEW